MRPEPSIQIKKQSELSIWEKESFFAPKQLIIVGSGLVGLWCAYFYKQRFPAHEVLILERGLIPTGASTRNAGFACFGSITELISDAEHMGTDAMLDLVELRYRGLQILREHMPDSLIDYSQCGGYDLLTDAISPIAAVKEKMPWLNNLLQPITQIPDTFSFADNRMGNFGFRGFELMVENRLEGYLHSGKLCQQLLRMVQGMGVIVLNQCDVRGFETGSSGVNIHLHMGVSIQSERLLICTNAFARELVPDLNVAPARGQVLLTSPIEGLRVDGTFHYDEGFYYFRNLGNRLLLGGARNRALEEESTSEFGITSAIQEELEQFLRQHILPGVAYSITDRWSGIMGMGGDKHPIIRKVDHQVWCAVRMSGMGVALAPVVAQEVVHML